MQTHDGYDQLVGHDIKPSVHRIAIMDYLIQHHTHSSVDSIYSDLKGEMPTLSRMTVYNTLKLLVEQGVLRQLFIDEKQAYYEADMTPHAHFRCNCCGRIYDVPEAPVPMNVPDGFSVTETHLYYRGICKECRQKNEKINS